jgi:predicted nucleic acid-binding protein
MRFWDSSAAVPLLVDEPASGAVHAAHAQDTEIAAWWATEVECVSALARLEREGVMDSSSLGDALERLDGLASAWLEVQPIQRVRDLSIRLLRVHSSRAADALQLAAALAAAEDHPETLPFVTLDDRLGQAAQREGFVLIRPTAGLG